MTALKKTNLIVGRNASGKTRTINALENVTSFMQLKNSRTIKDSNFRTTLSFANPEDEEWDMVYTFEIDNKKVIYEQFTVCGKVMVERDAKNGVLMGEAINPPVDKLTVQVRRDRGVYPDIETLMEWAESVTVISCSNLNPFTSIGGLPDIINPLSLSDLVENLSHEERKDIINAANELGYELNDIDIQSVADIKLICVKERYIPDPIPSLQLSSGMLRVIYLLCFLKYMKHDRKYRLLLIDDLGEGLDYKRATLLGRIVFKECEKEHIQLIASSNDSFLMDVVDISNWQILRRDKTKITTLNEENCGKMFDHFRMTGLSNFDLFSSDFIANYLSNSPR